MEQNIFYQIQFYSSKLLIKDEEILTAKFFSIATLRILLARFEFMESFKFFLYDVKFDKLTSHLLISC